MPPAPPTAADVPQHLHSSEGPAAISPTQVETLVDELACHTNFGGFLLGNAAAPTVNLTAAVTTMRSVGYWQLPLALAASVAGVQQAAGAGVPLPFFTILQPPRSRASVPGGIANPP